MTLRPLMVAICIAAGLTAGLDEDRNAREKYRDHPHFDHTAEFCELYDQCSFDPAYDTQPIEHFEPLVRRVLARSRWDEYKD